MILHILVKAKPIVNRKERLEVDCSLVAFDLKLEKFLWEIDTLNTNGLINLIVSLPKFKKETKRNLHTLYSIYQE